MTAHRKIGIDRIRYARELVSGFCNSLSKASINPDMRRALLGGRTLAESSINALLELLANESSLGNKNGVEAAYWAANQNILLLEHILKLEWLEDWQEVAEQMEGDSDLEEMSGAEFSISVAEHLIRKIESSGERHRRLIWRTRAALILLHRTANERGLDPGRTLGQQIRREISFPPEWKQAGISILAYFGEVISTKYPGIDVAVTIEQRADRVVLIVETPDGQRETIEQELKNYGLVVTGLLTPESYLDGNTAAALRLKQKLELAEMEVRHTKELLYTERAQFEHRIRNLEEHASFLRLALDRDHSLTISVVNQLRELATTATSQSSKLLERMIQLLPESDGEGEREELLAAVKSLKTTDRDLFERVYDLLLQGAIQGAAGNYFFALIQALARVA